MILERCWRLFENKIGCSQVCSGKYYVEVLYLGIRFMVVFFVFLCKVVRVDVDNDLTRRGYFFVYKDNTTDDNHQHPYAEGSGYNGAVCVRQSIHVFISAIKL